MLPFVGMSQAGARRRHQPIRAATVIGLSRREPLLHLYETLLKQAEVRMPDLIGHGQPRARLTNGIALPYREHPPQADADHDDRRRQDGNQAALQRPPEPPTFRPAGPLGRFTPLHPLDPPTDDDKGGQWQAEQ